MAYQGFNSTAFARTAATTLAKHITELEEAMSRNYAMGALLEAAGRNMFNQGGEGFDWPIQYRFNNVEGNDGTTERNFAPRNLFKQGNLEYRGYQTTDSMYHKEFLANRGAEGIVKIYDNMVARLTGSIENHLGTQYYIDGNLAGNEQSWHGFESMFGLNGTLNIGAGTQRAANAADKVGYPSDTYAGLSTILGNYGGDNEDGVYWPNGIADSEFDFWSPIVVNATSTAFGGSANTFAAQGNEAMRYGIINSQRNSSKTGQITNIFLSRDYYMDLLNLLSAKEEVQVTGENSLRAFGFKNVLVFDGMEVTWEAGVPTSTGYAMNYNQVSLRSMDDSLLRSEGPVYEIADQSYRAVVSTLSNLKFQSPRGCFKIANLA